MSYQPKIPAFKNPPPPPAMAEHQNKFEVFVRQHLAFIGDVLIEKNLSYGNAAADPMLVFSKADALERIRVRLDDKLTRIARGNSYGDEDTELDIIGYLVLKRYVELNQ